MEIAIEFGLLDTFIERATPPSPLEAPRVVFRPDGAFQGEVRFSQPKEAVLLPHGKGCMLFSDGRFFFGNFEDGHPHGWGTLTYPDQTVLHAHFQNSKPEGVCVYLNRSGIYLLGISAGHFTGKMTFFDPARSQVRVLDSKEPIPLRLYHLTKDEFREMLMEALSSKIGESPQANIPWDEQLTANLPAQAPRNLFFGSFKVKKSGFTYLGAFSADFALNGLGILVQKDISVCLGNFRDSKLFSYAVFVGRQCSYRGKFYEGLPDAECHIYDFAADQKLSGFYHKGFLKEVVQEKTQERVPSFLDGKEAAFFFGIPVSKDPYKISFIETSVDFGMVRFHRLSGLELGGSEPLKNQPKNQLEVSSARKQGRKPKVMTTELGPSPKPNREKSLFSKTNNSERIGISGAKLKARIQTFSAKNRRIAGLNDATATQKSPKRLQLMTGSLRGRLNDHHKNLCWNFNEFYREKQDRVYENYYRNIPNEKIYYH